ncbi:MAG: RNA-binding transcriptional accessory protein [Methanosarcinales archaeon]|nr:RNA-binding transcriptional accessory protein [Methanosarcinales archaeon]
MSKQFIISNIAKDLELNYLSVKNTVELFEDGATIPFIARYRKEKTHGLDETDIGSISEKLEYYIELEKRKETILKTIEGQDKLTAGLKQKILGCTDKNMLEDMYLPFKPRKRTRATIAKEKGLGPLAELIYLQHNITGTKKSIISKYIDPKKGVLTYEDALTGALDIIAEKISNNEFIRRLVRNNVQKRGRICSKAKKDWIEKQSKFQDYYEFSELIQRSPSHRMLAIRRGSSEDVLTWKIEVDEEHILGLIESKVVKSNDFLFNTELKVAVKDSFKRLIFPSIEKEVFNLKMEGAEKEAIKVFSKNLGNLLISPPAGGRIIMGIDPGYRTGCKVAVIDQKGDFKKFNVIYPHEPQKREDEADRILLDLIEQYEVELISIGNGTASKETDIFVRDVINRHNLNVGSVVVSEAGASVYSVSENAIKEFPDLDVTIRGAISIARRLQDPLAELVKIDPKSIGVGQYQHDIDQKELKRFLDMTVESCVNYVGVELNTASVELLSYVSGIKRAIAGNIVRYRSEQGLFKSRKDLNRVYKLGPRTFEQCAGFLRIRGSSNPLDNSAIHPETYHIVEKMANDRKVSLDQIIGNEKLISLINIEKYVTEDFGIPTLTDILDELKKPGIDPRKEFKSVEFSAEINDLEDLAEDMIFEGNVTNVTNFGAFVDIGVHQDGLVHISKLSNSFVKDPNDIISVGDTVTVKVLDVDVGLKRISLEMMD